ncbi:Histone H1.8 [Saguinus oedipus]|uniref:Histone H1.8 n=1 Tax=Saguinus oedipus TaxID=9490 RepID=A0ABQ9W3Z2_SAGOE|nr:Histone H1.8 [Saguinus oedipus]
MAPGSITSNSLPSSTSTEGSSRSPESEKPGPSHSSFPVGCLHHPVLCMVLEALQAREQHQGTSVAVIKLYILQKYPAVDVLHFKYLLKQALATGMLHGLLARPLNSKASGATGSFLLVTKHKRKIKPRKMAPQEAPRRASKAKGKVPKKPDEAKQEPPKAGKGKNAAKRPAEVQKYSLKSGPATEKA